MLTHEDIRVRLYSYFSNYFSIILNEVKTPEGIVDMILDYKVIIEIKKSPREFEHAKHQITKYAKYFKDPILVVTDGNVFLMLKNGKWICTNKDELTIYARKRYTISEIAEAVKMLSRYIPKLKEVFNNHFEEFKARKTAYITLLKSIYGINVDELFFYHTLIDIVITKFLTELVGTLPFSVSPPVINWWNMYPDELSELLNEIEKIAKCIDRSNLNIDLFRDIYEILIPRDIRKQIGEYYTPFWLCEYIVRNVVKKNDIVVDPFCGSGSFLISAFYHKVSQGRPPDDAIREVIGFDINPIAVSTARANLILAYFNVKKNTKDVKFPFVFLGDFTTGFISPEFYELIEVSNSLSSLYCPDLRVRISDIPLLMRAINNYLMGYKNELKDMLNRIGANNVYPKLSRAIDKLVKKYGDGVWNSIITSIFVKHIILNPSVIITNPPWGKITTVHGKYGEGLRRYVKKYTTQMSSADISHAMLSALVSRFPNIRHVFVMPSKCVFDPNTTYGLGKNIVKRMLSNKRWFATYIDYDVFSHNIYPSILYVNFDGQFKILKVKNASRKNHINEIEIKELPATYIEDKYEEFINTAKLPIRTAGNYIMGFLGNRGKYPGFSYKLIMKSDDTDTAVIKLAGTDKEIVVKYSELLNNTIEMIYYAKVLPFVIKEHIKLLKLNYALKIVKKHFPEFFNICKSEWKMPEKPKRVRFGVVWRGMRVFVASIFRDGIIDIHSGYIICKTEDEALYYAAILNYLAWLLKKNGYSFSRSQQARPIAVIYSSGLMYKNKYCDNIIEIAKSHYNKIIKAVSENSFKTADKYLYLPELNEMFERIHSVLKDYDKKLCDLAFEYGVVKKSIR